MTANTEHPEVQTLQIPLHPAQGMALGYDIIRRSIQAFLKGIPSPAEGVISDGLTEPLLVLPNIREDDLLEVNADPEQVKVTIDTKGEQLALALTLTEARQVARALGVAADTLDALKVTPDDTTEALTAVQVSEERN